jgi:molybdopterin-containing oxidoreductase family iron-sulfur binding subunit
MEKCTYCIQRINDARQQAHSENRPIGGDEVTTACQAACPTDAIVFGDQNNPDSQVATLKEQSHEYSLLAELSTQPRTTYLAAVRHPHPDLEFDAVEATQIEAGGDGEEEAAGAESDDAHGGE